MFFKYKANSRESRNEQQDSDKPVFHNPPFYLSDRQKSQSTVSAPGVWHKSVRANCTTKCIIIAPAINSARIESMYPGKLCSRFGDIIPPFRVNTSDDLYHKI